jgi:hypothetical protein
MYCKITSREGVIMGQCQLRQKFPGEWCRTFMLHTRAQTLTHTHTHTHTHTLTHSCQRWILNKIRMASRMEASLWLDIYINRIVSMGSITSQSFVAQHGFKTTNIIWKRPIWVFHIQKWETHCFHNFLSSLTTSNVKQVWI